MGTINYKTSELLTLATNIKTYPNDEEIKDEIENARIDGYTLTEEEARDRLIDFNNDYINDLYNWCNDEIKKYNFNCYKISCEPGYYDGFSIYIKFKYFYFDNYQEKQEAQKELTNIKKIMLKAVNDYFLRACEPGWCTAWYDEKETIKKINESIKQERARLKSLHTDRTFEKLSSIEKNNILGFNLYK